MGMADIAVALWTKHLRHNPSDPKWLGRDRFLLSNGHGSMLQYALLHLAGYDLTIDDLKNFRQLHSKTPGHPEIGVTPGVETSTGPLGQGIANAVGMALAEKMLAAEFNEEGYDIINNYTYAFLGDGCLMEGISHEVCSLAGVWKLNKLIALYDDNGISIDGKIENWFGENVRERFESYNWNVIGPIDGHDIEAVSEAIEEAKKSDKPTLIDCKTVIGFGSPNRAGTSKAHGSPLGDEELAEAKKALGWEYAPFEIPQEIYDAFDARKAGAEMEEAWLEKYRRYAEAFPAKAAELERRMKGQLPENWDDVILEAIVNAAGEAKTVATRKASQMALNAYAPHLPELLGGSADLTSSNLTNWEGVQAMRPDTYLGRHINYGVREFGMTAIANGISLHGGFLPYTSTFLMFVEYARNAVRMAALMKQRQVMVYTHDSIGLGEDGPTHQPVEQVASLRVTPNMSTWRPCDQVESAVAWKYGVERQDGPTALILSRQNLAQQERTEEQLANIARGGYVLKDCAGQPELIFIATGSEVELAVAAYEKLTAEGVKARVVSMPSTDAFDKQDAAYRESVLPKAVTARVAVEAGIADYWYKYVGLNGAIVGMTTFGESAPAELLFEEFGFTVDNVVAKAKELL